MTHRRVAIWSSFLVLLAALFVYAKWIEPNRLTVAQVDLPIPGLPPGLASLEIVFLTDLQIDRLGRREAALIDHLENISPDLLLIGGDFANTTNWANDYYRNISNACSVLAAVPAPSGKFAVWGNNDIPEAARHYVTRAGVTVLENEWVTLHLPQGELTLIGLDDPVTGRDDWDATFSPPPPPPMLMIAHSPDAFAEAERRGVPALLAGHTHGGQVWHPFFRLDPARFLRLKPETPAYRAGLYRRGDSFLYVSRGVGTSAYDFRFLVPPEVTSVRLVPASAP